MCSIPSYHHLRHATTPGPELPTVAAHIAVQREVGASPAATPPPGATTGPNATGGVLGRPAGAPAVASPNHHAVAHQPRRRRLRGHGVPAERPHRHLRHRSPRSHAQRLPRPRHGPATTCASPAGAESPSQGPASGASCSPPAERPTSASRPQRRPAADRHTTGTAAATQNWKHDSTAEPTSAPTRQTQHASAHEPGAGLADSTVTEAQRPCGWRGLDMTAGLHWFARSPSQVDITYPPRLRETA